MKPHNREHLNGHVVVWMAEVTKSNESLPYLEQCLDERERERAARFHFAEDRARFVLGRGLLRTCLGGYLSQTPKMIKFISTDRDRPILSRDNGVQFSVSHSRDLVGIALTEGARIGIDLEWIQGQRDLAEMAKHIFSAEDFARFEGLAGGKEEAFLRAWTRKEAYLKARGEGIAEGLPHVSVSFGDEDLISVFDAREGQAFAAWRLLALPLPEGYIGAVACDNPERGLDCTSVRLDRGEVVRISRPVSQIDC